MWLQSAGILDFAGKITECKIMEFKNKCRCYFTDMGLTYYFLRKIGADQAASTGQAALHDGKVDYLLLLKGNSQGGVAGHVITVPVFLFPGFTFDR